MNSASPVSPRALCCWPLAQAVEAARALGFQSSAFGVRGLPAEPITAEALALTLQQRLPGVLLRGLHLRYHGREPELDAQGPALLRIEHQSQPCLLALQAFQRDSAVLLARDGTQTRVSSTRLRQWLRQSAEKSIRAEIAAVLPAKGSQKRSARLLDALASAQLQGNSVPIGWRLSDSAAQRTVKQEVRFAALGLLGVAAWYALQCLLTGAGYAFLVQGALLGVTDSGWLQGWLLCLVCALVVQVVVAKRSAEFSIELGFRIRSRLLDAILAQVPAATALRGKGWMQSRVLEAGTLDSNSIGAALLCVLALVDLVSACVVLSAAPSGTGLLVSFLVLLFIQAWLVVHYVKKRALWTQSRLDLTDLMVEQAAGHRTRIVQGAGQVGAQLERDALGRYERDSEAVDATATRLSVIPRVWLALSLVGTAWASIDGWSGSAPDRALVAYSIFAALFASRALGTVVSAVGQGSAALLTVKHVAPLIARSPTAAIPTATPTATQQAGVAPRSAALDPCVLDVKSVSISDPKGRELLQAASLSIQSGDRIVLRGASGAGKSTLARTLAGHARQTRGVVLASGLDFESLGQDAWVKQVVLVPQFHENHLLSASLAYNVLMPAGGNLTREQEESAKAVCQELGLGELLDRMPLGVRQPVGDAGWQLSHGERSRVFIARALMRQARLVILDESIGALDPVVALSVLHCACRRADALLLIAHDAPSDLRASDKGQRFNASKTAALISG